MGTELAQFFKFPAKHFPLEIPPKRVNRIAPRGFVSKADENYTKGILMNTRRVQRIGPVPASRAPRRRRTQTGAYYT